MIRGGTGQAMSLRAFALPDHQACQQNKNSQYKTHPFHNCNYIISWLIVYEGLNRR